MGIAGSDVGRIADQQIKRLPSERLQPTGGQPAHPLQAVRLGIALGHLQCRQAALDAKHPATRPFAGQGQGNRPATRAKVAQLPLGISGYPLQT